MASVIDITGQQKMIGFLDILISWSKCASEVISYNSQCHKMLIIEIKKFCVKMFLMFNCRGQMTLELKKEDLPSNVTE
jgi:hypothetical protein